MESSRGQGGIQQLLAAEQEAQHIVNAARTAKMARLKQAKEEAEKEIAEYKAKTEQDFQRKLEEVRVNREQLLSCPVKYNTKAVYIYIFGGVENKQTSGDSGANVKRLEQETDAKIEQLKNEASRISNDVVEMLLKHVTTVKN
ncbi:V-type proton ATPase subunit G1 isoform X1 [Brassica napus]|uniref:V-type proton ATPase subunit G1 isoform X1 n=1 Tax=Brassica napus TaxID=3708 RepID=UPI0006AA68D0|nr:V-type proton ATPase subunit G1 isoform X1 [Brassica napus]